MIAFEGRIEVEVTPAEAFARLADMTELHRWNPNVVSSTRVHGASFEVGSRYESVIARGPIRMTARSRLVHVEPGRSVTYEGSIGPFWSVDSLLFEPAPLGVLITFSNESRPPRLLRPFAPLLNAAFQRQARVAVEGARRYLAASPPE